MSAITVEWNQYRVLPHGDSNGFDGTWEPHREVVLSERGVIVRLHRRERFTFQDRTFEGLDYRAVEIRRWHDGSLTIEREYER